MLTIDPRKFDREVKELLDSAGVPRARFHDLRHTFATFLLAEGTPARVVMELLGHSQIGITMNTYAPHDAHGTGLRMVALHGDVRTPLSSALPSNRVSRP